MTFRRCPPRPLALGLLELLWESKSLETDSLGLEALQALEIPQNRQRNLWKSLEKNSLDLERLGQKLGGRWTARGAASVLQRLLHQPRQRLRLAREARADP